MARFKSVFHSPHAIRMIHLEHALHEMTALLERSVQRVSSLRNLLTAAMLAVVRSRKFDVFVAHRIERLYHEGKPEELVFFVRSWSCFLFAPLQSLIFIHETNTFAREYNIHLASSLGRGRGQRCLRRKKTPNDSIDAE